MSLGEIGDSRAEMRKIQIESRTASAIKKKCLKMMETCQKDWEATLRGLMRKSETI